MAAAPLSDATGPVPGAFLADLRAALGAGQVVTDADVVAGQVVDWTGRWRAAPTAVVRPGDVDQVAAVVALARRHGVGLVPQGGNTGLVGGSVPRRGEVVVDLRRLDELGPVDAAAGQISAGAGVPLARLQAAVAAAGWRFAVDLGSRDSATVGGMVATNAGGLHVIRHGPMRQQVLGVEAVLGTGEVVQANLAGLLKDNTGYDLPGLLCGSEGTLGIVTRARLRLVPPAEQVVTALVGFEGVDAAVAASGTLRRLPSVEAIELMLGSGLALVAGHLGTPVPVGEVAAAVLVELAGPSDPTDELAEGLDRLAGLGDTAVATEPRDQARLWRWREAHPEAMAALGVVHKADVTLPLGAMVAFLSDAPAVVRRRHPDAAVALYGHLGDGNVHVNVVGPPADDDHVLDDVYRLVVDAGGSVSAEHGIGIAKRSWLVQQRGEAAVAAMAALKRALDPDDVLNPGVLLPT